MDYIVTPRGRLVVALFCCALFGCAHRSVDERVHAARRHTSYRAHLEGALRQRLEKSPALGHVGVFVTTLNDAEVLLAHNANELFVPASTAKVLTAATALDTLGPQYRFETQLWADGLNDKQRTVRTLYLKGAGDPSFALADLTDFVQALKQQGVRQVTGEIVIDDTAFDAVPWARGWMWDDLASGFSAPVSAVNIAGNALRLRLRPGRKGEPVRLTYAPATRFVSPSSEAVTVAQGVPHALRLGDGTTSVPLDGPPMPSDAGATEAEAGRPLADVALNAGQRVVVQGSMSESSGPQDKELAVRNPAIWAATLLREQLMQAGIAPPPNWRRGPVPPLSSLVASHSSNELASLLFDALKTSNNHVMECVLKRLGSDVTLQPGTFATGAQVVRRYVASHAGAALGHEPVLWDGSGLSRYNLVSPRTLGTVVRHAAHSFTSGAELSVGLPIAGLDGTLMHRHRGTLRGRVRAKTGTMTGVSALTGLLATQDNDLLVFAIMLDHYVGSAEQARDFQDDVLELLDAPLP